MSSAKNPEELTFQEILNKAGQRALGGGLPGAMAMGIQVTTLMWMRTTMNYQYRHGTSTMEALKTLYSQGGVRRFYRGYGPALFQGPLSRFGDTAANAGMLSFLDHYEHTKNMPTVFKSVAASGAAASWRICLMPIDACKTILQVEGKDGLKLLGKKVRAGGPTVLYHGALAASGATFAGHFPWFYTHNQLNELLPKPAPDAPIWHTLGRYAFMGFTASVVSDTVSNSIRVVKTTKQTCTTPITYPSAVKMVVQEDGLAGLFGRGLKTRILANGIQGLVFSVLWKGLEKEFFSEKNK